MIDWVGRHGPVQKWKMNFQKNKNRTTTDAHVPKTPDKPKQAHPNPTTTATGLRLEVQKLKNTIGTRKKDNPHNPELLLLNKLCYQKKKELIIDNKKQNSTLLHKHAHEIKVTPFNATMNTVWQLLHDYKSNETAGKSQLPSQMRTNKSIDKRLWWPDHIQRDPVLGKQGYHQYRYALGHDLLVHPFSPWDEEEATRVQADLDATHPSDSHIPDPQLNMRPTREEIQIQLKKPLSDKAAGPDGFTNCILQASGERAVDMDTSSVGKGRGSKVTL